MGRQIAISGIVIFIAHLTSSSAISNNTRREKNSYAKIKRGVVHFGNGYGYEVYPVQSTPTFNQFSAFASSGHLSPYSVADFKQSPGIVQIKKPTITQYVNSAHDSYANQYQAENFQHSVPELSANLRPKNAQHLITYAPQHSLITDQHPKVFQKYTQAPIGPTNAVLISNSPLHNYNQQQVPYQNNNIRYPVYKSAPSPQFPSQMGTLVNQYPKSENFQTSPFQIKISTNNLKHTNYYNPLENRHAPYLTQNVQYSHSPFYEVPKRLNPQVIISEQQPLHLTFPSSSIAPMDQISENFKSIEPQYTQQPYKNTVVSQLQNFEPRLQESYDIYNQQDNRKSQSKFPVHSQPINQEKISIKQLQNSEKLRSGEDQFKSDELKEIFVDDEHHQKDPESNEHRYYMENEEPSDEDFVRSAHYDDDKYSSVVHNADKEPTYFDDYERFKSMGREGKDTQSDPLTYDEKYYHSSDEIPPKYTHNRMTKHKNSSKPKPPPLKHSNSNSDRKPSKAVATKSAKDSNEKDHRNFGDRPYSFNSLYTKSAPEMSLNIYNDDEGTHYSKGGTNFVKPKYQYDFEPIISGYTKNKPKYHKEDSEGKYTSNHPMAVKKIYKENWYISKTTDD